MKKADSKPPMFGVSLFMLDNNGKPIVQVGGGNNSIMEVTRGSNFRLLSKEFRHRVKQYFKDEDSVEKRKQEWSAADRQAAADRKKRLAIEREKLEKANERRRRSEA